MAQKANQRVVPISIQEYDIVKKDRPESVANIENQSTGARLCLFCPYKLSPYINFHHSPGEICVPKCTLKQSNRQQYNLCAEQLNIDDRLDFNVTYENQTIVMYNPLISPGRKCRVPEEFSTLLASYVLLKINTDDIAEYTVTHYNLQPYVIQRHGFNQFYTIYTEYDFNSNYCLVFKSDLDDGYLITVDETSGKVLSFNDNSYIENFFKNNAVKVNSSKNNLFNHMGKLLRLNISDKYNNTTDVILQLLNKEYGIEYVYNNDYIVGILHKNIFYCTPLLFVKFIDKTKYFIDIHDIIVDIEKRFPSIDSLNKEFIDAVYKDYSSDAYNLVVFDGIYTFIKRTKHIDIDTIKNTVLFDYDAYMINFLFMGTDILKSESKDIAELDNISKVLIKWLSTIDLYTATTDNFMKILTVNDVISDTRKIVWSANNDYILWRSSKVTKNDVLMFIDSIKMEHTGDDRYVYLNYINHAIYKQFRDELIFHVFDRIEKVSSKKITM